MPNTTLVNGDYTDLFLTSSAMIHDCGTFTVEYLYLKKPVMFVGSEKHADRLTKFGRMCFNQHYVGDSIEQIRSFLDNVVLNGQDPKQHERENFFTKYLLPPKNRTVAENIYEELRNI